MRPAGTYRNINSYRESRPFFAFHRLSVEKIGHLRARIFSVLPISAALDFKIFLNVTLRVKSFPTPTLEPKTIGLKSTKVEHMDREIACLYA